MNKQDDISAPLDADTDRATSTFMRDIRERFRVRDAFLFGSRARRTHTSESDADVAVVLEGERGNRFSVVGEMSDIAYDVLLRTGVNVQPVPIWEDEFNRPELFNNPSLIANIKREGVRL